jgi:hypothetical protein
VNERQAHEAILQHWHEQWSALQPSVPWTQLNELSSSSTEWVRVAIVPALSQQAALGKTKRWRRSGTIGVQIFSPVSAGTDRVSRLADDVRTCLEGQFITGDDDEPVVTLGGSSGSPLSDGVWFMLTVTVPYSFDELRAD